MANWKGSKTVNFLTRVNFWSSHHAHGILVVVHDGADVVGALALETFLGLHDRKIVLVSRANVAKVDFDVPVAVRSILGVVETQRVDSLVLHGFLVLLHEGSYKNNWFIHAWLIILM